MTARRFKLVSVFLAATLLLAIGPGIAAADGKPGSGNGGNSGSNSGGKGGGSGSNAGGNSGKARGSKNPSKEVQGRYDITIAGYYRGSGTAQVTGSGITIAATVRDPAGKTYKLTSGKLDITDERFKGDGDLSGFPARIDGRVDPADEPEPGNSGQGQGQGQGRGKKAVLKKARIMFTFSAEGHRARGAGAIGGSGN